MVGDPIAVETGDGKVLLRTATGKPPLAHRAPHAQGRYVASEHSDWLHKLAHDFVLARRTRTAAVEQRHFSSRPRAAISPVIRARRHAGRVQLARWAIVPLRRFAGRALIAICDRGYLRGYYDSGLDPFAWVPIPAAAPRYRTSAQLVTRVLDSAELQTTGPRPDRRLPAGGHLGRDRSRASDGLPAEEDLEASPPDTPRAW
jgi:hypothetical protein